MCPMCFAAGAAILAGTATTGGLAAFAVMVARRGRRAAGPEGAPPRVEPASSGAVHHDVPPKEEA